MARSQNPRIQQQVVEAKLDDQELSYSKGFSTAAIEFYRAQKTALQTILRQQKIEAREPFLESGLESKIEKLQDPKKKAALNAKLSQLKARNEQLEQQLQAATKAHQESLATQADVLKTSLVKAWNAKAVKIKKALIDASHAYVKERNITTVQEARDKLKEKFLYTAPTGHKNEIFTVDNCRITLRRDINDLENYTPENLQVFLNSVISNTGDSGVAYKHLTDKLKDNGCTEVPGKKYKRITSFALRTDSLQESLTAPIAEAVRNIEESTQSVNAAITSLNDSCAELTALSQEITTEIAAEQVRLEQERLAEEQRKRDEEARRKEELEKKKELERLLAEEQRRREREAALAEEQARAHAAFAEQQQKLKAREEEAERVRAEKKKALESKSPTGSSKKGPKKATELGEAIRTFILRTTKDGKQVLSDKDPVYKAGYSAVVALRQLCGHDDDLRRLELTLGIPVPLNENNEQSFRDITDWAKAAADAAQKETERSQRSGSFVLEPYQPPARPVSPKVEKKSVVSEVKIDVKETPVESLTREETQDVLNKAIGKVSVFLTRQIDSLEQKGQEKRAAYLQSLRGQVATIVDAKNTEELSRNINRNLLSLSRINQEFGIDPRKPISGEEAARPIAAGFDALFNLKNSSFNAEAKLSKPASQDITKYVRSLEDNTKTVVVKKDNLETLANLVTPGTRSASSAFVEGAKLFGSTASVLAGGGGTALGILHWVGMATLASAIPFAGWIALSIAAPFVLGYGGYRLYKWFRGSSDSTPTPAPTSAPAQPKEVKVSIPAVASGTPTVNVPGSPTQSPKSVSSSDSPRSPVSYSERKSAFSSEDENALRAIIVEFVNPHDFDLQNKHRDDLSEVKNAVNNYWEQQKMDRGIAIPCKQGVISALTNAIDKNQKLASLIAIAKNELAPKESKPTGFLDKLKGCFPDSFFGKKPVKNATPMEKLRKEFCEAIAAIEQDQGKKLRDIANKLNVAIHRRELPAQYRQRLR